MHGFVKKGLLVSLASGALMVAGAGWAAASDSASANGSTSGSEGIVTGNVAQGAANVPIQVCGDTANAGTANDSAKANACSTTMTSAMIDGATSASEGAVTGNVIGVAANTPAQACGVTAAVLGTSSGTSGNTCVDNNTSAAANGSATNDSGLGSGNVIQVAWDAPIQVCGDASSIGGFNSGATGNTCSNG